MLLLTTSVKLNSGDIRLSQSIPQLSAKLAFAAELNFN
jgi:hypothetical protein